MSNELLEDAVLASLNEIVPDLTSAHISRRKVHDDSTGDMWMPSDLIPKGHVPPSSMPDEYKAMLVLNMLTEEGLPYFFGLLTQKLGDKGPLWDWVRIWTAEEDRHGTVLYNYQKLLFDDDEMVQIERIKHGYLQQGFWPEWMTDATHLLAYVVLQEKATQVSHAGIGRGVAKHDPILTNMLAKIAGEEGRHYAFYLGCFKRLLSLSPFQALSALFTVIKSFSMPGVGSPHFDVLAYIQMRAGVFGSRDFKEIIELVYRELGLERMNIPDSATRDARDKLLKFPRLLERSASSFAAKAKQELSLPFLEKPLVL